MVPLTLLLVSTIIASLVGAIIGIRQGGLRAASSDARSSIALKWGAGIGFVIGLFGGFWCIPAAALGAAGAWVLSFVLYNRKMN